MDNQNNNSRDRLISYAIKDKQSLYMSYMPFLKNGGLFVPSKKDHNIGDPIFLLIQLMGHEDPIKVSGKVVWINPSGALGSRPKGIGVHFTSNESKEVRYLIEEILGTAVTLDKPTYTM